MPLDNIDAVISDLGTAEQHVEAILRKLEERKQRGTTRLRQHLERTVERIRLAQAIARAVA